MKEQFSKQEKNFKDTTQELLRLKEEEDLREKDSKLSKENIIENLKNLKNLKNKNELTLELKKLEYENIIK